MGIAIYVYTRLGLSFDCVTGSNGREKGEGEEKGGGWRYRSISLEKKKKRFEGESQHYTLLLP